MCYKTQGVVTVRKEEPEKQQLGLLEGNKKMQFLLNALQAPSAKKEDKNKKSMKKTLQLLPHKIDRIKKHYTNKLNYLEETVNF